MNTKAIKRVVIAGGGTAGWVTAAALTRMLGDILEITLVESDDIGTIGVGEASIPPMRAFHKLLKIDEQEFMRETEATFKLGISFENWGNVGESYLHSFGKTGKETWLAEFHHFWLRAHELGFGGEFGDYCFELQAARANKFATSKESKINYAYHLDATRYARYLRRLCENEGVNRLEGKIAEVIQHPASGDITGLKLESGALVEGDLFIDCTGFRGLLIEQTLHTGYDDWSHWLPCDSAVAVQTESTRPAVPYTRSIAHESGWQWQIPLQHRVGNGLVYCSHYLSDEDARALLLAKLDGKTLTDPRLIKYRTGRRRKLWNKNCVAIGLSGGFIEPLESTSIHLIMMGITRLMQNFPFSGIEQSQVDYYNTLATSELEKIRDFIVLHYHQTQREDSPFWRYCKGMDIPLTLKNRMELFRKNATAYQADGELFRVDSWTQVMMGQGLMPEKYHHATRKMSDVDLKQYLAKFSTVIKETVNKMPLHSDFIANYCNSKMML